MIQLSHFRLLVLPLLLVACSQLSPTPAPVIETQAATYAAQDLGSLSGNESYATAMSADEGTVVGYSYLASGQMRAFLWTAAGGMKDMGTLGGSHSSAIDVSADGGTVVGYSTLPSGQQRAFLWSAAGGMEDLGTFGGTISAANDVSADGETVVGYSTSASGTQRAFIWTRAEGMEDLGVLGGRSGYATGVSADGTTVVGRSYLVNGQQRAFLWTAAGGMKDLGTLGGTSSIAYAVSADGGTVVGNSTLANGQQRAFLWAAGGMRDLGTLGGTSSYAWGVSADGRVVVGESLRTSGQPRAFVWTAASGMKDLSPFGIGYGAANDVSADGGTVVGRSSFASGGIRATRWRIMRTPQAITFNLTGFGKTYGDAPFTVSAVASSALPVAFASDTPAVCTVSESTVALLAAGTCTLTASQAGDATYAAAKGVSQSFPVVKAAPFTWFGNSPTVGERGGSVEVVVTSSSDAPITLTAAPETVCTLTDKTLSLLALGDCTVAASQVETANFLAGSAAHTVKVVRTLTPTRVSAVSGSSVYGGAATLVATLTGRDGAALAGETVSFEVVALPAPEVGSAVTDANGVATLGGVDLQGLAAGNHPVIASFAGDDARGLEASHALGEVTVAQAAQTVSFSTTPPNPATVGGSYTALVSASSSLPVTLVSDTPGVCTLSGSTVSFVGTGTCTLTASQAGDANVAAASAQQSFAVAAPTPAPMADTYRLDFERAPANRLVYSVALGGGMVRLSGDDTRVGTVPVVGKRRVGSGIDPAHLARVVSLYGSKRLVVASPNSNSPAPTGGRVKLSFTNIDPKGVTLTSLTLSNLTARGAYLTFYYANGASSQQNLSTTRAGGSLVVALNVAGLRAVDVFAPNAFAVDDVTFVDAP